MDLQPIKLRVVKSVVQIYLVVKDYTSTSGPHPEMFVRECPPRGCYVSEDYSDARCLPCPPRRLGSTTDLPRLGGGPGPEGPGAHDVLFPEPVTTTLSFSTNPRTSPGLLTFLRYSYRRRRVCVSRRGRRNGTSCPDVSSCPSGPLSPDGPRRSPVSREGRYDWSVGTEGSGKVRGTLPRRTVSTSGSLPLPPLEP